MISPASGPVLPDPVGAGVPSDHVSMGVTALFVRPLGAIKLG